RVGILHRICGDVDQTTFDRNDVFAAQGREANGGILTDDNAIDVIRTDSCFHHQLISLRHDLGNGQTRIYHAANGVNLQVVDDAIGRRLHVGAGHYVRQGEHALAQILQLRLRLCQSVSHFGLETVLTLDDLQTGFADLHFGRGDVG